jgi:ABC-2 type transport system ATP-binding protein
MGILKVSAISKSFGGYRALDNVSFEVEKGEILGILGPNGAGKTTLIHIMLGLIIPDNGTVEAFGTEIAKDRAAILSRMNFASNYVSLPYTLTLRENLMVYALMYGVKRPAERCRQILGLFGLEALRDRVTRELSSGQMMRLSLAKAMINEPDILLLDEPTAGLDPEIAKKTRELLKGLSASRGLTVIYTSHNLFEMQQVAGRVIFLNKGTIAAQGRARELFHQYGVRSLEELFFKVLENE